MAGLVGPERGQATVEWTGLVLLVALVLAALVAVAPVVDGRSLGSALAHSIVCATRGDCDRGNDALVDAYGPDDAQLLRRFAPNIVYEPGTLTLPVDFRRCRAHRCSDAPDDPSLDAARSNRGVPAAAFTHVVRRDGATFLQYWFYYPDSNTVLGPSSSIWTHSPLGAVGGYPGYHEDDWEAYFVRIDAGGDASVRATSHHGYQGCKERRCRNRWMQWTGWTRVSKGSHAGHIPLETEWVRDGRVQFSLEPSLVRPYGYRPLYPGVDLHERTTGGAGLDLIPIETLPPAVLSETSWDGIAPPWLKEVYLEPMSNSTS
ncbi:MAG: hypothetical protein QOJ57_1536 [Thermoleophilaceae bacterium]|nr:hypothetical protein [Thermoleophilaceae bacterium]